MLSAQAVVIRGKVYVGGGSTWSFDDHYLIQQYSPTDDKWSFLPPAPVYWFGMGEMNGQLQLVIVGGKTRQGDVTGHIYTFDNLSQTWRESIPPMPTARYRPAVFSQPCLSCLTVVGGSDKFFNSLSDVEIFMSHTSQWHKAYAPFPLSTMSTTVINNKCFLAEYYSTKVYQMCVSLQQATDSSVPKVILQWKDLPDLPYQRFALGNLNGCLLAVGGEKTNPTKAVQSYSPITNTWKRVGSLSDSRCNCSTLHLPSGELLVLGGVNRSNFSYTKRTWKTFIVLMM